MKASDGAESGVNSLLPKLQTRLVVLPGTINTHQLHRHYTRHNTTANRLLQRLEVPEQLTARYTAGVLPTTAIQGRYQRYQRTESFVGGESLADVSVVQRSTGNDSGWQQYEQTRIPTGEESSSTPPISNSPPSPTLPGTYRVSRRPNLAFNSSPDGISVTTDAGKVDSTDAVTPHSNSTPNPSQSSASSIQLQMQPHADNNPEKKVVNTTCTLTTIQRKYGHSEGFQSANESTPRVLYRVAHRRVEKLTPTAPSSSNGTEEFSDSNLELNSSVTTAQASLVDGDKVANTTKNTGVNIQRKYHQSELMWHPGSNTVNDVSKIGTVTARPVNNSTVNSMTNQTGVALQRKYHQSELLWHPSHDTTEVLASSRENNVFDNTKSNSINTFANVTPAKETQAAGSGMLNTTLVQAKPLPLIIPGEEESKGNSPISNQFNLPLFTVKAGINTELPLAVSPNNNQGLISRQTTTTPVESVTSETINAIPTSTASSSPSSSGVDIGEIAEQVSRIIMRRLVVERERRGMGT